MIRRASLLLLPVSTQPAILANRHAKGREEVTLQ